jgi:hypothetical protein
MTDIKPVAWMWQHGETGATGFLCDAPDAELKQWERMNKPRKIVLACYPESALLQAREEGRREGMREAAQCRAAVPVLIDEMPDEMWEAIRTDKDACTEAMRIAVRQTLDEYEEAITRAAEGK